VIPSFEGLAELLFPSRCIACAKVLAGNAFFCETCDGEVERLPLERCRICAEPGNFGGEGCPRCRASAPSFSSAFAPFSHRASIARAIHRFKYEDHPDQAAPLASLLAEEARSFLSRAPELVVAVPLHRTRLVQRKYDQAQLLGRALAQQSGRKFIDGLRRVRPTRRQVELSEVERQANVTSAFEATKSVAGTRLLLIDDVFTTGATARAASEALISAGAAEVQVLTLARAHE
jgi:ComF family protein